MPFKNLTKRKVSQPKRINPNEFVLEKNVKRTPKTNHKTVQQVETGATEVGNDTFSSDRGNATESNNRSRTFSSDRGNATESKNRSRTFSSDRGNATQSKNRSRTFSSDRGNATQSKDTNMGYPGSHSTDNISDDQDNISETGSKTPVIDDDQIDVVDEWGISSDVDQSNLYNMDHEQKSMSNQNMDTMSPAGDSYLPHSNKHLDDLSCETPFHSEHSTQDLDKFSNDLHIKRKKSNSDLEDVSSELSFETAKKKARLDSSAKKNPEENIETTESKNELPASFTIKLNKSEWKTIKPKKNDPYPKLCSSWTDIFSDKMAENDVPCVLQFFYNRIKKPDSKKFNARYFHGKARCKFETCTQYRFEIAEKPRKVSKNGVTIKVTRHGEVKHPPHQTKRRQLRGERRKLYQQQLQREGASSLHYKLLSDLSQSQHAGGNHTIPSSKPVLRQAKYEMKKEQYLHTDEWTEVVLTRQIQNDLDEHSKNLPGYIQFLSYQPFITISFTERQLQIFRNQKKLGRGVLYLDATGSVVKKQCGSDKPVYYYAAVVRNNKPNEPSLPIAEMLTNEHTTTIISLFLGKLKQELMASGSSWTSVQPRRIEVDFSWSLINSALVVCNQENITAYLYRAWEIATEKRSDTKFTKIHLCSAHLIKRVRDRLGHTTSDKGLADFCTFAFALLQNSSELVQAESIYGSLCTILGSEYETKSVRDAVDKIEKQIAQQAGEKADTTVFLCPQEDESDFSQEKLTSTIKDLSPFTKFFAKVKNNIPSDTGYISKTKNRYYNKQALTVLESYLHIYPLWSGLLLKNENYNHGKPVTRDTNCCVENWFRIVKQDILNKKKYQRPGQVLEQLYKNILGRSREYQSSMESKILPDQNQIMVESDTLRQDHIDMAQEQWRPITKPKTSKFYTPPKHVPKPTPDTGEERKPKRGQKRSLIYSRQESNADFVNSKATESENNSWINSLLVAMKGWLPTPIGESSHGELDQFLRKLSDTSTVNVVELISELQTSPEFSNMEFGKEGNPVTFLHHFLQKMHKADLFQPTLIQRELECLLCSTTDSPVQEKVLILMVNLTAPTVQSCINDYFKPTTQGIQQRCSKCQALTDHHQRRSVLEASDVLVIILKRFTESPQKHLDSVTIEKKISVRTVENNSCDYDLQSIQLHHGNSVYGGYYTAVRFTARGMISYDGKTVTEKEQDYLLSAEAQTGGYMMFYKKMDTSKKSSKHTTRRCRRSRATQRRLLLKQEDMKTLEARSWLNDQVVNAYMATLEDKYPVRCLDSFLLEELKRRGVSNVSRKINTTDKEFLLIPLHQQSHWSLIVVDVKKGAISYLDPLGLVNRTNMKTITDYLKQQAGLTLVRDKEMEHSKRFPTQKNTYDCGVYILEYARCIAAHQRCTQANMKKGRERIKQSLEEVYTIQLVVTDD